MKKIMNKKINKGIIGLCLFGLCVSGNSMNFWDSCNGRMIKHGILGIAAMSQVTRGVDLDQKEVLLATDTAQNLQVAEVGPASVLIPQDDIDFYKSIFGDQFAATESCKTGKARKGVCFVNDDKDPYCELALAPIEGQMPFSKNFPLCGEQKKKILEAMPSQKSVANNAVLSNLCAKMLRYCIDQIASSLAGVSSFQILMYFNSEQECRVLDTTVTNSNYIWRKSDYQCPTAAPTAAQTAAPTAAPTAAQTAAPTAAQTAAPTAAPTAAQTTALTAAPTIDPTAAQTTAPTAAPTIDPTIDPTAAQTTAPTEKSAAGRAEMNAALLALAVTAVVKYFN